MDIKMIAQGVAKEYEEMWEMANLLANREVRGLPDPVVKVIGAEDMYAKPEENYSLVRRLPVPKGVYRIERRDHHLIAMVELRLNPRSTEGEDEDEKE